jgi:hypothetical protein
MKWLDKILGSLRRSKRHPATPVAEFDDDRISCRFPDGTVQQVPWDNLRAVVIERNDRGPWEEDVHFILFSDLKDHFCAIPQCAKGT